VKRFSMSTSEKRAVRLQAAALLCAVLLLLPGAYAGALEENYGANAWALLQIIDASYPNRITDISVSADTSGKDSFGAWIASELSGMGYAVDTLAWNLSGNNIVSYVARKQGKTDRTLTIGAHYDSAATKGVDDNGTGVALTLELARRFKDADTYLSLDFCFWDGEETLGYAGSYSYLDGYRPIDGIVCYLNLDSLGAGDRMYAYGGEYTAEGSLINDEPLRVALAVAGERGIELCTMPEQVTKFPTPTRTGNSDQYYFAAKHVPYVYFEANAWVTPEGTLGRTDYPQLYNSSLECFAETNGQIIHMAQFEDLATLEALVPGRIQSHLTNFSILSTQWILRMDELNRPEETTAETSPESSETSSETSEEASESITETVSETETSDGNTSTAEKRTTGSDSDHLPDGRDRQTDSSTGHEDQNEKREASGEEETPAGITDTSASEQNGGAEERQNTKIWITIGLIVLAGVSLVAVRTAVHLRYLERRKR